MDAPERLAIGQAIQAVINAARRYRDSDGETDKPLFALFDALECLDLIEDRLPDPNRVTE